MSNERGATLDEAIVLAAEVILAVHDFSEDSAAGKELRSTAAYRLAKKIIDGTPRSETPALNSATNMGTDPHVAPLLASAPSATQACQHVTCEDVNKLLTERDAFLEKVAAAVAFNQDRERSDYARGRMDSVLIVRSFREVL